MISIRHIRDVDYYIETPNPRTPPGAQASSWPEPAGTWWSPKRWQCDDGTEVSRLQLKRLTQGRDARTGRTMARPKGKVIRVACDYTFSVPQSLSGLWAVSNDVGRMLVERLVVDSVRFILVQIIEMRLIESRRGKSTTSTATRENPAAVIASLFLHVISRDADPQMHVHALLLNLALRQDGTIGAINNEKLIKIRVLLDSMFRSTLAKGLERMGVPVTGDSNHGFRIIGEPPALNGIWAKRRSQIVHMAHERSIETKDNAKQAAYFSVMTRTKKSKIPTRAELEDRWKGEALNAGHTLGAEWSRLDRPPIIRSIDQDATGAVSAVREAVAILGCDRSIWRRDQLLALSLTLGIGRAGSYMVPVAIERLIESKEILKQIESGARGWMTTLKIMHAEQKIVQLGSQITDQSIPFGMTAIEAAMNAESIDEKQKVHVRDMLTENSIVNGKYFTESEIIPILGAIHRACSTDGRRLLVVNPQQHSIKSDDNYSGTASVMTFGEMPLINSKQITPLVAEDVVVVRDADTIDRYNFLSLLLIIRDAKARVIFLTGKARSRLKGASDPLALLLIGTTELDGSPVGDNWSFESKEGDIDSGQKANQHQLKGDVQCTIHLDFACICGVPFEHQVNDANAYEFTAGETDHLFSNYTLTDRKKTSEAPRAGG